MKSSKLSIRDLIHVALVAALYVVLTVTPGLSVISFGAIQFRISEMLSLLAFYNPKYWIAVTIGCVIANAVSPQSLGLIDVVVGASSTFVFVGLSIWLFRRFKDKDLIPSILRLDHFLYAVFFSISMVTIAWELNYVLGLPFWLTWLTTALGEFASLIIGALIVRRLDKVVDFTK